MHQPKLKSLLLIIYELVDWFLSRSVADLWQGAGLWVYRRKVQLSTNFLFNFTLFGYNYIVADSD